LCRECNAEKQKAYRLANPEKFKTYNKRKYQKVLSTPGKAESERKRGREYWHRLRKEALDAYGAICTCCGETEELFLTFDHVNNDGADHRRSLGYGEENGRGGSSRTLKWMKDNNWPDNMQVLCMNCNLGKQRNKGVCPHQIRVQILCEFRGTLEQTILSEAL